MDLQLSQLRALVAVDRTGTFTDAAAALGASQAAVSRAIAALEAELGVRVLQRSTRHVSLTPAGGRVLSSAHRVLDEIAHLRRIVAESDAELRLGYAWAAVGKHTRNLQRKWAEAQPAVSLVFVQSNSPTAGLSEGTADIAIIRRPLTDSRFDTALIGVEARYAALATDNPLARRRNVRLADLARYPIAIDSRTGTTTPELWQPLPPPADIRDTHGVDEWLTLIAAGQAVGITSEATANQNPRPGVAYRAVRDARPIPVSLAWWKDAPPRHLPELLRLACEIYGSTGSNPGKRRAPTTLHESGGGLVLGTSWRM